VLNSSDVINILYCVKIKKEEEYSFPNKYESWMLKVSRILFKISTLQINFAEIFCKKEQAIKNRLIGIFDGYNICFVDSFEEVKSKPNALKVLFSDVLPAENELDSSTIVIVPDDLLPIPDAYLHISTITPAVLKMRAIEILSALSDAEKTILEDLKKIVGFEPNYAEGQIATTVQNGFYNRINIAVLESLRLKVSLEGTSPSFNTAEIESLVNRLIQIRSEVSKNSEIGEIAPAVHLYFSDVSSSFEFDKDKKNISRLLEKYKQFDPKILKDAFTFAGRGLIAEADTENDLIAEIEDERLLLDALIVLSAANNVVPVVKLPLSNNKAFQQVMLLATSDRNKGKKTNALIKQVREAFSPYIDNWLEYMDNSPSLAIKLVSNLPLEWTHHQGLPLMIRHEVSRIPVTPGYVTSKLLLDSKVIHLSQSSFKEILFISSFEDNDPIKNHLKDKLAKIEGNLDDDVSSKIDLLKKEGFFPPDFEVTPGPAHLQIHFKWVEVSNAGELIDAINNNPCAVTVFDLHGSHKIDGGGCIHLKNETVYASDLIGNIKISPIVILSTCDASPIDKGHESMAESFFLAGAKTVISSALPINSDLASTFLARLLVRLQSYLPAALSHNTFIRWSTLVSGMIRRTYYYELLTLLQKKYRFSSKIKSDLIFRIGIKIDPLHPDWINSANNEIISILPISIEELNKFVLANVQFVECMKYFQLGRPELVVICPDNAS